MNKLELYERVRSVPKEAQKNIGGGRLKGMTDINPMWRIKTLTEEFGPCGVGWYYTVDKQWIENSMASDEIAAYCDITLYIKVDGEWSMGIPGTGGAMFVSKEKNGYYTDDECFKKARTDAISVACKQLGIGADIYWQSDRTKYSPKGDGAPPKGSTKSQEMPSEVELEQKAVKTIGLKEVEMLTDMFALVNRKEADVMGWINRNLGTDHKSFADLNYSEYSRVVTAMNEMAEKKEKAKKEYKVKDSQVQLSGL